MIAGCYRRTWSDWILRTRTAIAQGKCSKRDTLFVDCSVFFFLGLLVLLPLAYEIDTETPAQKTKPFRAANREWKPKPSKIKRNLKLKPEVGIFRKLFYFRPEIQLPNLCDLFHIKKPLKMGTLNYKIKTVFKTN